MTLTLASMATACVESEEPRVGVVASIETEDDLTVEFTRLEDGSIIVSEVGPMETPSRIAMYAEDEPTAFEVFRALAPSEEAPSELEMDHYAATDAEPRDLSITPRGFTPHVYATSCTFADDWAWFIGVLGGTGWTDWDYWSGTNSANVFPSFAAQHMITHVCNHDGSEMEITMVGFPGASSYSLDGIDKGERGIVYLLGSSSHVWFVGGATVNSSNAEFRQGYMAP